jgi:hypothetical protein
MKKAIILVVIMLISVNYVASQDNTLLFTAKMAEYSETGKAKDLELGEAHNVIIKLWTDDDGVSKLSISNAFDDRFTLLGNSEESFTYDKDIESKVKHDLFDVYDKDGVKCLVLISVIEEDDKYYTDDCKFRIRVAYNGLLYGYYCKMIKL